MEFGQGHDEAQADRIAKYNIDHFANGNPDVVHLDGFFADHRGYAPEKKFVGNVHFHTKESLAGYISENSVSVSFPVANLIRHPITRLDAHFRYWSRNYHFGPNCMKLFDLSFAGYEVRFAKLFELFAQTSPDFRSDLNKKIFAFSVCDSVSALVSDFRIRVADLKIPHFKMEDLKSDREKMRSLISFLTEGQLKIDESYLDFIYEKHSLEAGRLSQVKLLAPEGVWSSWEPWQHAMFEDAVKVTGWITAYEDEGYDFSFLSPDLRKIRSTMAYRQPPRLLGSADGLSFNFVKFDNRFWAVDQHLGEIDFESLATDGIPERLFHQVYAGDTIEDVEVALRSDPSLHKKKEIGAESPLLLEENFFGFNIVAYEKNFWAISQAAGPVDLASPSIQDETADSSNLFYRAASVEQVRAIVRARRAAELQAASKGRSLRKIFADFRSRFS